MNAACPALSGPVPRSAHFACSREKGQGGAAAWSSKHPAPCLPTGTLAHHATGLQPTSTLGKLLLWAFMKCPHPKAHPHRMIQQRHWREGNLKKSTTSRFQEYPKCSLSKLAALPETLYGVHTHTSITLACCS